jgi:hypothetical protein
MTSAVSIVRSVPMNDEAIVPLLRAQLEIVEEASEHGTVVLAARLPGNGSVAVAVLVRVSYPPPRIPRFGLTITARNAPDLYPRFSGGLEVARAGTAAAQLTLSGEYHVPFGMAGPAVDAADARGIGPRGLEDLLDALIADVVKVR